MARNKFDVDEELESEFNLAHLKRIMVFVKPYRKPIYMTLFVILLANVATMLGPYLTKVVIDTAIPEKNMTLLAWIGVVFSAIGHCDRYMYEIPHWGNHTNWTGYFKRHAGVHFRASAKTSVRVF